MTKSLIEKLEYIFLIISIVALILIVLIMIVDIEKINNCLFLVINLSSLNDLLIALFSIGVAGGIAVYIYKIEFADDSDRMIDKEVMLIKSSLEELNEVVRNTRENIDASREKGNKLIKRLSNIDKYSNLKILAILPDYYSKENDYSKFIAKYKGWNIVMNTYFFSSLENYLHNGKQLNENIIYHINRIRKIADLINMNRQNKNKYGYIIKWTIELDAHIYGLIKAMKTIKICKITNSIDIKKYAFLEELKKDFWKYKESIKKDSPSMEDLVNRIEEYQ